MDLKLLGDLQVYDLPYLSLYADEASHSFYLAFRISTDRGLAADYVVTPVSTARVLDYIGQKVTVRDIFRESDKVYLWHKRRGIKGGISNYSDRRLEEDVDDSKFNPSLCEDKELIINYLQEA